jgi:class 3 adenylate cyclase/pimeloyl-ACP methyl ester carboxylesterase
MRCPRCEEENLPRAKFCSECGAPLVRTTCPNCGVQLPGSGKFCPECAHPVARAAPAEPRFATPESYTPRHLAEKILTSRAALEGERKQVTILFVDVSAFTALSENLDPEDVHQVMDHAFELMLAEVHRYEGTVNQFLGDGLMALFGAPLAHEDHPVRAVHTALGIQRALAAYRERLRAERSIEFQVRMGLNTGAVVVGSIGDNLRMDYTAVGDTTNVAARFLALAEPGQILVSDETARLVNPYFRLQPLGEFMVKGKARPVRAFRVEGARAVRSRLEAQTEQGLTPFVGRQRELAILHDRFAEALGGRGQAVFVFGEAGVGKSRLLLEFRRHAEAVGGRWLLGRCVSYGRAISYLPVLDLVRDFLELKEGDSVDAMLEKIDAGVARLGADLAWTAPFVRALLSLDQGEAEVRAMTPAHRRGRTAEALRELLIREGQRAPLTVVIEDLHWIDPHSEEVLRLLLEGLATVPMLVLLTYRPGYVPTFGDQTYYTRITLRVLPGEQTATMVESVLRTSDVPPPVLDLVARRAEGNPLFIEELSKALVEDGTLVGVNGGYRLARKLDDVAIPDTVQGVIMARIDRLADAAKTALQVASVIGREFTARLVERVSAMERQAAQALGELRAVELIYEKATYPELAYMFKHALTHDVAYESLLKQRRRVLHRRAGEVIEELYADRLAEFYETLAWHYMQGESWPKAADYLLKSAAKARDQFNYGEATRLYTEAIDVLKRHGGEKGNLAVALEALGDLESLQSRLEPANAAYDRALALADELSRRRIASKRHRPEATTRDGARIAYYEHGSGEPTLLLLSPITYGIGTFQALLELLCEEFRILTIDPRGQGGSDPMPVSYSQIQQAEDVRVVIEAAGSRPVVFIGISGGGVVGVHLATEYPHLVAKLITIGTPVASQAAPDYPGEIDREFLRRMRSFVAAGDYQAAWALHCAQTCSEPGSRNLIEVRVRLGRLMPPEVFQNFFAHYRNPDTPGKDIRHLLPQLHVPTLVLHGEEDRQIPVASGRYMADHIPGAQFYGFKGRCHLPTATATAELARVVRNFVRTGRP